MTNFIQNMAGMKNMTEQIIASDMLITAKNGIKNYASALTETSSPEVRTILKRHLTDAIETHEKIASFMVQKGLYNIYDPQRQINDDVQAGDTVRDL